jgi:hypothetical protein
VIGAALARLVATAATLIVSVRFLGAALEKPFAGLPRPIGAIVLAAGAGAGTARLLDGPLAGLGGVAVAVVGSAAVAGGIVWLADRRYELGLAALVRSVAPTGRPPAPVEP